MTTFQVTEIAGADTRAGRYRPVRLRVFGRSARLVFGQAIVAGAVIAAWQLAVQVFDPRPDLLPAPSRVWSAAWDDRSRLWENTVPTLIVTIIGVVVAFGVAALLAALLDFFPSARRATLSLFVGAQSIPIVAVAPLVVIWFGFGMFPKILLIVVATFFPLTIATVEGLNAADREAMRLLRSMGANRLEIFWHLRLPSSLPFVITGLRVVMSYAVTAAVFAEYVGSERGLGIYLQVAKNMLRTDLVFAVVIIVVIFSVLLFMLTYVLEALVAPWERRRKRATQ